MELSQIFSGLVFLVSAIHLTHSIGTHLWASSSEESMYLEDRPFAPRDDWYLFFHCSALWGTTISTAGDQHDAQQISQTSQPGQQSRPRPRPRAGAAYSI